MIFVGLLLVNVNMRLPIIKEITPDDNTIQVIIGIALIVSGFIVFKKQLGRLMVNKNYAKKPYSKPTHQFLEFFGLN